MNGGGQGERERARARDRERASEREREGGREGENYASAYLGAHTSPRDLEVMLLRRMEEGKETNTCFSTLDGERERARERQSVVRKLFYNGGSRASPAGVRITIVPIQSQLLPG